MSKFTPGEVVTAAELEVGDTVFLRERKAQSGGLPIPTHAVVVTDLVPFANGRVEVTVKNANSGASVEPRLLGQLPASREFRRAVPEA